MFIFVLFIPDVMSIGHENDWMKVLVVAWYSNNDWMRMLVPCSTKTG
jgi:hypothetical protein